MISDTELGWLAGIFEGEGSARIYKTRKQGCSKTHWVGFYVASNSDPMVLERTKELLDKAGFNATIRIETRTGARSKRLCGIVKVKGQSETVRFLEMVLPLLNGYKRKQAELILSFLAIRKARWSHFKGGPKKPEYHLEDDSLFQQQAVNVPTIQ